METLNPQRNLDWKKVFKNILLKEENVQNNFSAPNGSGNFEVEVVKEALSSSEHEHSLNSELSESENRLLESSVCALSENLTVEVNIFTPEAQLNFNSNMSCNSPSYFKNRKSKEAPKWNKVFKEILGDKQSKDNLPEKCESLSQAQYMIKLLPQKKDVGSEYGAKGKPNHPAPGYKKDPDEEKVREQFASWARVKPVNYKYNLNDFDGEGVNIFKDRMKKDILPPIRSRSGDLKYSSLSKYSDRPFEKDVPLTGFVAVKRCTKADVRNISQIELSEVWDDDLLF